MGGGSNSLNQGSKLKKNPSRHFATSHANLVASLQILVAKKLISFKKNLDSLAIYVTPRLSYLKEALSRGFRRFLAQTILQLVVGN